MAIPQEDILAAGEAGPKPFFADTDTPEQTYQKQRGFLTPVKPTTVQQQAAEPAFAQKYPAVSAMNAYGTPYDLEQQWPYRAGGWLRENPPSGWFGQAKNWAQNNPDKVKGMGLGAGVGAGVGLLADRVGSLFSGNKDVNWLLPLLGAGAGTFLMSGAGTQDKAAAFMFGDPAQELAAMVQADHGLALTQKMQILSELGRLSPHEAARIRRAVGTGAGASIGLLVARMLGLNLGGSAIGGILGGLLGNAAAGSGYQRNALGQPSLGRGSLYR